MKMSWCRQTVCVHKGKFEETCISIKKRLAAYSDMPDVSLVFGGDYKRVKLVSFDLDGEENPSKVDRQTRKEVQECLVNNMKGVKKKAMEKQLKKLKKLKLKNQSEELKDLKEFEDAVLAEFNAIEVEP